MNDTLKKFNAILKLIENLNRQRYASIISLLFATTTNYHYPEEVSVEIGEIQLWILSSLNIDYIDYSSLLAVFVYTLFSVIF